MSREALREAVGRTLTREAFTDESPDGTMLVEFTQRGSSWTAVIRLRTAEGAELGAREIGREANDCRSLDAALVLVTAMLVDAARANEPKPITIRAEPAAELAPPAPGIAVPAPSTTPPSARKVTFVSGLAAAIPLGFLPTWSLAPTSWLRVGRNRLSGELGLAWFARVHDDARPGGVFDGGWASLGVCPTLAEGASLRLVSCARGALALMRGTGTAVTISESGSVLFGQLGLGVRGSLHLTGPLWLAAGIDGWLPLYRPSFTVRDGGGRLEVFSPSPVFGTASLGLELLVE